LVVNVQIEVIVHEVLHLRWNVDLGVFFVPPLEEPVLIELMTLLLRRGSLFPLFIVFNACESFVFLGFEFL
jgi:hypothetical protein